MLVLPDQKVCFIGVPKTGTRAIEASLYESYKNGWPWTDHQRGAMRVHVNKLDEHTEGVIGLGYATFADCLIECPKVGIELDDNYKRFAVHRNPYDRFVSYVSAKYKEEFRDDPKGVMLRAALTEYNGMTRPMVDYDEEKMVWLPYEGLRGSYHKLMAEWGVEPGLLMTIKNKSDFREKDYKQYYTDDLKEIIAERYAADLQRFGYSF